VPSDLARGAHYALRGARFVLARPALWPLVLAPFLLSLAALVGLGWLELHYRAGVTHALTPHGWLGTILGPLLTALYVLAAGVMAYFLFLPVASLIASPFNELLAERVEELELGLHGPPFSLLRTLRELGQALVHETRKFFRWLLLSLAVLACTLLLPGVGAIIGLVGGWLIAARFAAYDSLDATLSRRGWSYERKVAFLRSKRALTLGLGGAIAALMLVPVVNALALPFGAAGAALMVHDVAGAEGHPPPS
jgi:CysZ protein